MNTKPDAFATFDDYHRRYAAPFRSLRAAAVASCLAVPVLAVASVGDLDPQFGSNGQVQVVGNLGPHLFELPDGRVLVVGQATSPDVATTEQNGIALSRLLPTGAPDTSFGYDGRILIKLFDDDRTLVTAATQQLDGRLVLAGQYWRSGGQPFVARIDRRGAPDPTFGSGGISEPGAGGTEPYYSSVLVREDGDILAAISDWTSDRIDRFGADGRPLGNFLRAGVAPAKMARQSDGRLIVSGYNRSLKRAGVARLNTDGSADPTFGDNGFAELDQDFTGNLAIEPRTDRIVLCGRGLVRLTSDGHPDTAFGLQGTGYVGFGHDSVPSFDYCQRLLTMADGSVVFIGVRSGNTSRTYDCAFVAGLTSSGLADLRYGAGSGASALDLGSILGSPEWWGDVSSALIKTRDGDALLSWVTAEGLRLARIDLDGNTGNLAPRTCVPPLLPEPTTEPGGTPAPEPSPSPEPTPEPGVSQGGSSGGGGAFTWLDLLLIVLASTTMASRLAWRVRVSRHCGAFPPARHADAVDARSPAPRAPGSADRA